MTLVYLALAWLCGIWACHQLWALGLFGCATPGWPIGAAAGIFVLCAAGLRRRPASRLGAAILAAAILAAWRYHAHPFAACATLADLSFYNGDERRAVHATVEGVVMGYPDVRDVRTQYTLHVETVTIAGRTRDAAGALLVRTARFPEYAYGDRLRATGQLQTPPRFDDFDYRAYLAGRGIHSLMPRARVERIASDEGAPFWTALYALRAAGSRLLNRVLPEPAAALANGMTLGIESGIPPAVEDAFQATGATHVIVISGSNIALLSGVLMRLLSRLLGRRWAVAPTIAGIALYVLLVGADPAATRAGLMGILYVIAIALGRESTAFVSLAFSALVMTLVNPLALWDAGFQLSGLATLGLILFTPTIAARLERFLQHRLSQERARQALRLLNDSLIVTLAAQIATLPLIVYYFGRLSLISLFTNFLILPAQPPILMGGLATLIGGLIWEPVGRVLAVIPWLFLTYTTAVVRTAASVPLASVEAGAIGQALAPIYYAALFGWLLAREVSAAGRLRLPSRRAVAWAAAALAPVLLIATVVNAVPDGRLHLLYLPVEDGEAVLIVTPTGRRTWVWDGRGDGAALLRLLQAHSPGWRREPDAAVQPALTLRQPNTSAAPTGGEAAAPLPISPAVDPLQLAAGASLRLDEGVSLTRLHTANSGWAFTLRYGEFSTLLPATCPPATQAALLAAGQPPAVTLLKTPGPGVGAWPTAPFLAATAPQLILWPLETTYPPDVAEMLASRGAGRVPADAVLEVVTDGKRIWLHQRSNTARR
ncbi:MAG: ComEC family competence protein [Chloroflexi bacterium]|nr:ComEC family competence protein [Chloroflexota bacterium]